MQKNPEFEWDPETGSTLCTITDGINIFYGTSKCSPEDKDMMNKLTGSYIAQSRAEIHYFIHLRDNEIKPALKALNHLYGCMKKSSNFNSNSYENKMLQRQIHQKEFDLITIKDMINTEKETLKTYLDEKDKFYKRIRYNREYGQK